MAICPNCGKCNSDGNKFCVNCGSSLENIVKSCPNCGHQNTGGSKFCVNCGNKLDGTESQQPQFNTNNVAQGNNLANNAQRKNSKGLFGRFKKPKIPEIYYNEDESVRIDAVKKEDNQDILKYLADNDKSRDVKEEALKKISDLSFLERWLSENRLDKKNNMVNIWYNPVKISILNNNPNLTDEFRYNMIKEGVYGYERDYELVVKRKITDENFLKDFALNFKYPINWRALEHPHLKDNDFLINFINTSRDNYAISYALRNPNLIMTEEEFKKLAKHSDENIREEAVKRINDVEFLKKIALTDNYERMTTKYGTRDDQYEVSEGYPVRRAAESRLKELGAVYAYNPAWDDSDEDVRRETVKEISDESILAEIAKNDSDKDVRRAAVRRISDDSILTEIAINDSDEDVRRAALSRISDESVLNDVASTNNLSLESVRKGDDESFLVDVVRNSSDAGVRREAVKKISDEAVLAEVAKNDSDEDIVMLAMDNITNKSILEDIASARKNNSIKAANEKLSNTNNLRLESVRKSSDESFLVDVVRNDSDAGVRREAVKKISDEAVLVDVVRNDSDAGVRREAVKKISDEAVLKEIAKIDKSNDVRAEVVKRISDEKFLTEIALNESDQDIRFIIVKRISDEKFLTEIALNESDQDIRMMAVKKITDENALINIANNDLSFGIRCEAIGKINNKSVLEDILSNEDLGCEDPFGYIHKEAKKRLEELGYK